MVASDPNVNSDLFNPRTHPGHVLHEDGESFLVVVPQTAIVLDDALVMQIF